ncbi:MAG: asparagine synthase (glutamine-hydrolyzing) [Moorea sp. SIO2B7]|nr:asparagine synthase (glutamine-hydrolyzing) [Moorena sp. SIO2B7]
MCGFAGFIEFQSRQYKRPERLHLLQAMGKQLSRRGPDDEKIFDDGLLSFVFRRLSIVDVAGGQQPIWNEDSTIFVAVNGEIYNHQELRSQLREYHQFRTQSDAEIVLHLFEEQGAETLHSLNGMFAIVIWDTRNKRLFLARDRLGIKPLYYCQVGSQLIFGSELKSLLIHPDCPNKPRWYDLQIFTTTSTYVKGINYLPGGHYLTFDITEEISTKCYWSIEKYFVTDSSENSRKPEDYISDYGDLFADSVKKRLMSDVPLGAFLSGGIDSSVMVAAASEYIEELHCFHVLEKSTFSTGDTEQARDLAQFVRVPFHPVFFNPEQLISQLDFSLSNFEYFIWILDSPRFDFEFFFKHELHRYAKTIIPELKVILLGQGADEFTGGYCNPFDSPTDGWDNFVSGFNKEIAWNLVSIKQRLPKSLQFLLTEQSNLSVYQKVMLLHIVSLQEFNLWHEDRTASSQGIEARVPFLDHRLVEFLASIPPKYHPLLFWDKKIVRKMSSRWLPDCFLYRPKVSFFVSRDLSPIGKIMHLFLGKIFPEFREKYLESSDTIFSRSRLIYLFNKTYEDNKNIKLMQKLFNCMAMAVFDNLCRTLREERPLGYLNQPSPLNEVHELVKPKFGS